MGTILVEEAVVTALGAELRGCGVEKSWSGMPRGCANAVHDFQPDDRDCSAAPPSPACSYSRSSTAALKRGSVRTAGSSRSDWPLAPGLGTLMLREGVSATILLSRHELCADGDVVAVSYDANERR